MQVAQPAATPARVTGAIVTDSLVTEPFAKGHRAAIAGMFMDSRHRAGEVGQANDCLSYSRR